MAQAKIIITEREDETPICPHCKKVLGFGQSRMM